MSASARLTGPAAIRGSSLKRWSRVGVLAGKSADRLVEVFGLHGKTIVHATNELHQLLFETTKKVSTIASGVGGRNWFATWASAMFAEFDDRIP
jgi:hypothetical protein